MLKTNYNVYSDELYHHGIQGQKWGQRNGPPYPLSQGMRTAAERKENKKSSYTHPEVEAKKIKKTKKSNESDNKFESFLMRTAERIDDGIRKDKQNYKDWSKKEKKVEQKGKELSDVYATTSFFNKEDRVLRKDAKEAYKSERKELNDMYRQNKRSIKRGYRRDELAKERASEDAFKTLNSKEKLSYYANRLSKSFVSNLADDIKYTHVTSDETKQKVDKLADLLNTKISETFDTSKYDKKYNDYARSSGVVNRDRVEWAPGLRI